MDKPVFFRTNNQQFYCFYETSPIRGISLWLYGNHASITTLTDNHAYNMCRSLPGKEITRAEFYEAYEKALHNLSNNLYNDIKLKDDVTAY